jgi:hypothetical protein
MGKPMIEISLQNSNVYYLGSYGKKEFGLSIEYFDCCSNESFDDGAGGECELTEKEMNEVLAFLRKKGR